MIPISRVLSCQTLPTSFVSGSLMSVTRLKTSRRAQHLAHWLADAMTSRSRTLLSYTSPHISLQCGQFSQYLGLVAVRVAILLCDDAGSFEACLAVLQCKRSF